MQHFFSTIKPVTPRRNDVQVGVSKLSWVFALMVMLFFLSPGTLQAAITKGDPGNFITTWDTTFYSNVTNNNQIRILGSGGGYDYDVYWENVASSSMNGTTTTTSNDLILTFPEPGIYRVEIAGAFPRIYFDLISGDKQKILEVNQ